LTTILLSLLPLVFLLLLLLLPLLLPLLLQFLSLLLLLLPILLPLLLPLLLPQLHRSPPPSLPILCFVHLLLSPILQQAFSLTPSYILMLHQMHHRCRLSTLLRSLNSQIIRGVIGVAILSDHARLSYGPQPHFCHVLW
jgi:hypothetical protein